MSTIQKIRDLYKTRKYKQAYLASTYGVSSAQTSRIVNLKRRQFVGNEEIAFADEQKQNAREEIAFADKQKRNAYRITTSSGSGAKGSTSNILRAFGALAGSSTGR